MTIGELSTFLGKLEKTSSRLEITEILAELFAKSDKDEIDKIVYMLLGKLAPSFKGIVFNVAEQMMIKAIAEAYRASEAEVKLKYKQLGDLGEVAEHFNDNKTTSVGVSEVYEKLLFVAEEQGDGSSARKVSGLAELMRNMDARSVRFAARVPVGKLRLGFSDKTILDALSWMETGGKDKTAVLERAYEVLPDVGLLAREVKIYGIEKTARNASPRLGTPVLPMLPQRLKSTTEMIGKMGQVAVEPKFDGLRVQIHYEKSKGVRAFTRNLNEISGMFPELSSIGKCTSARSAIFDSEAIGLDSETKKFASFQMTMNRRRKHGIAESALKTPIRFQMFDILYLNGANLMQEPYSSRREVLQKTIKQNKVFSVDEFMVTDDPKAITLAHKKYIAAGLEGVIVKKTASKYVPGRTGWRWVKMKEAEEAEGKLADTVDVVIMGYTQGKGKRAGFGVGQFLAGVQAGENIKTITKVGTGLTDEQFRELSARLKKLVVGEKPEGYEVHKDLTPDFWVAPEVVVELAADELTISPKHTAGFALRFPRLVKFRDDKSASQATTLTEIKKLYKLQKS